MVKTLEQLAGRFLVFEESGSSVLAIIHEDRFLLLVLAALFLPYFSDILALISDISYSLTVYILPCLFYWKLNPPAWEKALLCSCIAYAITGRDLKCHKLTIK